MSNTICHDGYCEPALNREASLKTTIGEKAIIVGVYLLLVAASGALLWYGASMGYYPDPALLN
jgi:hypothetical protein